MKRRIFPLAVLLALALSISVQAVTLRAVNANPVSSFDGTTAVCYVNYRTANVNDKADVTLTLYRGNTVVDSWSESGTYRVYVSGECKVRSGVSYNLVMTHSINGRAQSPVTTIRTCP